MSNDTMYHALNAEDTEIVIVVKRVFASISLLGGTSVLFMMWLFDRHKGFIQRLIMSLTIAMLLGSICFLVGDNHETESHHSENLCKAQAFLSSVTDWAILLWICCITFTVYRIGMETAEGLERKEWLFHLGCWLLSILISILPFFDNAYGPAGAWCWIKRSEETPAIEARLQAWRFGAWFIPATLLAVGVILAYVHLLYVLKRKRGSGVMDRTSHQAGANKAQAEKQTRMLMAYPIAYIILNFLIFINRVYNAAAQADSLALYSLSAACNTSLGVTSAIIYFLTDRELTNLQKVKNAFWAKWMKMRQCRSRMAPSRPPYEEPITVCEPHLDGGEHDKNRPQVFPPSNGSGNHPHTGLVDTYHTGDDTHIVNGRGETEANRFNDIPI